MVVDGKIELISKRARTMCKVNNEQPHSHPNNIHMVRSPNGVDNETEIDEMSLCMCVWVCV